MLLGMEADASHCKHYTLAPSTLHGACNACQHACQALGSGKMITLHAIILDNALCFPALQLPSWPLASLQMTLQAAALSDAVGAEQPPATFVSVAALYSSWALLAQHKPIVLVV